MMKYFIDKEGHVVCIPYSRENLRRMADDIGLAAHWMIVKGDLRRPHYLVPEKKWERVARECLIVTMDDIIEITKGDTPPGLLLNRLTRTGKLL